MLKVIESELMSSYYMIHRLVLLATRTKGIPKHEPNGIHVTSAHHSRNFSLNDIDGYQESSNVIIVSNKLHRSLTSST
jgi:hypothetical protein